MDITYIICIYTHTISEFLTIKP